MSDTQTYYHIKKDDFGNEIAKFPVTVSKDYININELYIEAWDMASLIKEKYAKSLDKAIEDGRKLGKDILYFIIMIKKDPTNKKNIHIKIAISDKPLPNKKYESVDYWTYDYRKEKLVLNWSIPHKTAMKNYLKEPDKYDKQLIMWIKQFIDQEGLDIKSLDKKKIKIL